MNIKTVLFTALLTSTSVSLPALADSGGLEHTDDWSSPRAMQQQGGDDMYLRKRPGRTTADIHSGRPTGKRMHKPMSHGGNLGSSGQDGVCGDNLGSSGQDGVCSHARPNIGSSGMDGVRGSNLGSSGQDGVRGPGDKKHKHRGHVTILK